MIETIATFLIGVIASVGALFHAPEAQAQIVGAGSGTISTLDQWAGTTTPYTAIAPRTHAKNIYAPFSWATTSALTATTICITGDTCRTTWPSGSGSSVWPFTTTDTNYGVAVQSTTTPLWLKGTPFSLFASTTAVFVNATTTQLTTTDAWVTKLRNLTSNGFVKTGSGDGTLSVDTTTYESGLTAGDGLTRTVNDFDCDTASASVFGCMASIDWSLLHTATTTFTSPLVYTQSTNAVTLTTSGTWSGLAGTASALAPGANINGTAFTGASNITITAASSTLLANNNTFSGTNAYGTPSSLVLTNATGLPVAGGGTGASTLTGCLTGNGTGAITGSGTCNTSAASVTSITGGLGLNGGAITGAGTLSLKNYLATSTADTANQVLYFTSTNATPATFGGDTSLTYNGTTDLLTLLNASSTALSISAFLQIPNTTAETKTQAGVIGLDTTSNQLKVGNGTASVVYGNGNIYPAFTYSTSTAWTGTTTRPLGTAFVGETWDAVECWTDAGTLNYQFHDGTNKMDMRQATGTVSRFAISTNNTFTASEKRFVDIGTPATSPTYISCTVSKALTAD